MRGKSPQSLFRRIASRVPIGMVPAAWLAGMLAAFPAQAGDFTLNWGSTHNWTANSTGPLSVTMTDQYGFQLGATMSIARIGGAAVSGYPNDLAGFGSETSIWLVWDANNGSSGVGESTNTATLSFTSGGSPFTVDGLSFRISDIDSTDNNNSSDRCDFVTVTGNAGNPALTYVSGVAASRSVRIGPGTGSGSTGALAANQAQCIYNTGSTGSPASAGDDFGSILATFPAGTSTAIVAYDESIENVYGVTSRNAAARGIGIWGATAVVVNQSISLTKTASAASYTAAGETITYTYVVTNNGRLPINTGQNIQIQDDKIGTFTCGTITSAIPSGGTHTCTANYTTTAGDALASGVTNNATAGVGTGAQSFATRLQSNTETVTVPRAISGPGFVFTKTADKSSVTTAGEIITYTMTAINSGGVDLTGVSLTDTLTQGGSPLTLTSGPTLTSGDTDSDGVFDTGETWVYSATFTVTTTEINNGSNIVNVATLTTNEAGSHSDAAQTTTPGPTFTCAGDNFTSANVITGASGSTICTNAGATGETGEPTTYGGGSLNTIWYSWTAPATGTVTFDTCSVANTNFDTTLKAYTGSAVNALTTVAQNDDFGTCTNYQSLISFAVTSGTTYSIQVDGYASNTGDFQLSWSLAAPSASISKAASVSSVTSPGTVAFTIVVSNTGTVNLTSPSLADVLTQNGSPLTLTSGPVLASGDANGNGTLETTETWVYAATYDVTQADIDDGNDLLNTATFSSAQTSAISDSATITFTTNPSLAISKTATLVKGPGNSGSLGEAGDTIQYSYAVTNDGNITFANVEVADLHDGTGPWTDPSHGGLTDNGTTGDSPDTNGDPTIWGTLAPGDTVTFATSYTITQQDFDAQ